MKNIHLLPTDKPSRLKQNNITKKISLVNKGIDLTAYTPINIYITSPNEDINENDYIITKDGRLVQVSYLLSKDIDSASKVTLATDVDLIKDGVQDIDDEFLAWFMNNQSCENVKIEDYGNLYNFRYLILIPKEEPKQETFEEAAERLIPIVIRSTPFGSKFEWEPRKERKAFIKGAKWQAERMYSEEDMKEMYSYGYNNFLPEEDAFKQFKNKQDMKTKNSEPTSQFESKDKCPSCGSYCNIYLDLDNNDECNDCRTI